MCFRSCNLTARPGAEQGESRGGGRSLTPQTGLRSSLFQSGWELGLQHLQMDVGVAPSPTVILRK